LWFLGLVVSGGELLVGVADEDDLVDNTSESTTNERANPVDPVVGPGPANNGRAECDGGVHCCSGEGPTQQNVGANDETNGDGGDGSQTTPLGVNGGGVDGVHQTEGHHDLQHQSVTHSNSSWESKCGNRLRSTGKKLLLGQQITQLKS